VGIRPLDRGAQALAAFSARRLRRPYLLPSPEMSLGKSLAIASAIGEQDRKRWRNILDQDRENMSRADSVDRGQATPADISAAQSHSPTTPPWCRFASGMAVARQRLAKLVGKRACTMVGT